MSSKGRRASPTPGQRPASRTASSKPPAPAPPPPSISSSTALPALPRAASKRFDWIDSSLGDDAGGSIKAARPASRTAAAAAASGRASPDFWARSSAPQLLDASVKHPELKLQLLARALEESRAKVAQLQQDKAAVADAILQLCEAAAADSGGGSGGMNGDVGAGPDATLQEAGSPAVPNTDEDALPQQLDLLSTRLGALREALAYRTVAAAEAAAAHERAAVQLVAQRQQREAVERQLEEVRWFTAHWIDEQCTLHSDAGMAWHCCCTCALQPCCRSAACACSPSSSAHHGCPAAPAPPALPNRPGTQLSSTSRHSGLLHSRWLCWRSRLQQRQSRHASACRSSWTRFEGTPPPPGKRFCKARLIHPCVIALHSSCQFASCNASSCTPTHPTAARSACRSLRTRFLELEQQLDAARKAQAAEADRCRQLEAASERLQGRLKEANAKQAELSQQLW